MTPAVTSGAAPAGAAGDLPPPVEGLLCVDKPGGWTSHDVVARLRRLARTRRVGHAGTLDPMATGVLVLGTGRATKLLGHLALTEKTYRATLRLGRGTVTDDAEGEVTARSPAAHVPEQAVRRAMAALTGVIEQVPSSVSAVKVDGVRSYARVRSGREVTLAARQVTVRSFELLAVRRDATEDVLDCDVVVACSSGTYVRALARDVGAALGVGGHLTALRRTAVGHYSLADCHRLDDLARCVDEGRPLPVTPLDAAVALAFPRRDVDEQEAAGVVHGRPLPARGEPDGPFGVFGPDGRLLALAQEAAGRVRYLSVFAGTS